MVTEFENKTIESVRLGTAITGQFPQQQEQKIKDITLLIIQSVLARSENFRLQLLRSLPPAQIKQLITEWLNNPSVANEADYGPNVLIDEIPNREYLTEEALIEKIFLTLVNTKQQVVNKEGKHITVRKYYFQTRELVKIIAVAKPTPKFIINSQDLDPILLAELRTIDDLDYVLKQAVGILFENIIDPDVYRLSIAKVLKVRLTK